MKKRDKKLSISRETVRDLTITGSELAQLQMVLGGSCNPGGSTHQATVYCVST